MEGDKRFRELIDRSFVEEVSEGERQLIHDHIRDCDGCKRYLELTARTIRGLREFTFTSERSRCQLWDRHLSTRWPSS